MSGSRHRHALVLALAVVVATASVQLFATGALALDDPLDEITGTLPSDPAGAGDDVEGTKPSGGAAKAAPGTSSNAAAESTGSVVDAEVDGNNIVTVSKTSSSASAGSSGGASSAESGSDAVLLAVLGNELFGSHADSGSGTSGEDGLLLDVTNAVCDATGGSVCLSLLYSNSKSGSTNSQTSSILGLCVGGTQTSAADNCDGPLFLVVGFAGAGATGTSSVADTSADTAVADACVGSGSHEAAQSCDGLASVRAAEAHSSAASSTTEGAAGASNSTLDLCLGGETGSGVCNGVGLVLLRSESTSSAAVGSTGQSEESASVVALEVGGEEVLAVDDQGAISLPSQCPAESLLCLSLNETDSTAGVGSVTGSAEAVGAEVLSEGPTGNPLIGGSIDNARTSVGSAAPGPKPRGPGGLPPGAPDVGGPLGRGGGGGLPFTGSPTGMVAAMGMLVMVAGAGALALSRVRLN